MQSKYGGIPVESESKFGGVPVKQPKNLQKTKKSDKLETVVEQALQGVSFGFGDEMQDFFEAAISAGITEESFSEAYKKARDKSQPRLQRQQEERPGLSTVSQLGGAVVTGGLGAATKGGKALLNSVGRSGLGGRVAKSAAIGSATGAVSGTGSATGGLEERYEGGKSGALLGAAVGGALPAAGSLVKGVANTIKGSGKVIKGRDADAIVAGVLRNQDLKQLTKTIGDDKRIVSLADIAGDEAQGLLRSVAKKTGGTKNQVADFLENRSISASERIDDLLTQKVSSVDTYFGNLDDIAKGRSAVSAPLYKTAYEKGANLKTTTRFDELMQDRRVVKAMNNGKRLFGVSDDAKPNSIEAIDGAKKALDDDIGALQRAGRNQAARQLVKLKEEIVGIADEQVPEYKKARGVFSGFKAMEDAQVQGSKFLRESPEMLRRNINKYSSSEHDAFLIGVRRSLIEKVESVADGGDPAKRIFGNQLIRKKIQAIFPKGGGYKEFSSRMIDEINAADTKFKVLGGSRSDFNIAQDGSLLIDSLEAITGNQKLRDKVGDAIFTGVRSRALGITDKNAKLVANILIDKSKGVETLNKLIAQQNKTQANAIKGFIPDFNKIKAEQLTSVGLINQGNK